MRIFKKKIFKIKNRITRMCPVGTVITCANTAAKKLKIIGVLGLNGVKRRRLSAGIGSIVKVVVKTGPKQLKNKVYTGLIIRCKYGWKRENQGTCRFFDNAGIILEDNGQLKKGSIRGLIAKQVQANIKYVDIDGKCV